MRWLILGAIIAIGADVYYCAGPRWTVFYVGLIFGYVVMFSILYVGGGKR